MLAQDKDKTFTIRITQHEDPLGPVRWWYWNKIGQEFEATEKYEEDIFYYVLRNSGDGIERECGVLKTDSEVKPNGS